MPLFSSARGYCEIYGGLVLQAQGAPHQQQAEALQWAAAAAQNQNPRQLNLAALSQQQGQQRLAQVLLNSIINHISITCT